MMNHNTLLESKLSPQFLQISFRILRNSHVYCQCFLAKHLQMLAFEATVWIETIILFKDFHQRTECTMIHKGYYTIQETKRRIDQLMFLTDWSLQWNPHTQSNTYLIKIKACLEIAHIKVCLSQDESDRRAHLMKKVTAQIRCMKKKKF